MHHFPLHDSFLNRLVCSLVITLAVLICSDARADDYEDVLGLMRAGKYTESLTKADAVLASKPKDVQMLFIKGSVLQASGQSDQASVLFTKLTEDHPELPEPYNNLAVILAAQSQFEKARIALEMAIRNKPDYATAYENLGDVYAKLASQAYEKALQFNPMAISVKPKQASISEVFKASPTPVKKTGN